GTARRCELDQRAQVAEVADTPVALRTHAIELHHEAPDASQLWFVAAACLKLEARRLAQRTERAPERFARRAVDVLLASPDVEIAFRNLAYALIHQLTLHGVPGALFDHSGFSAGALNCTGGSPQLAMRTSRPQETLKARSASMSN